MRAATNVGLTFVGAQRNYATSQVAEDDFKPRVIPTNEERVIRAELRAAYAEAMAERAAFWIDELAIWAEEFGPSAVSKLREVAK